MLPTEVKLQLLRANSIHILQVLCKEEIKLFYKRLEIKTKKLKCIS